MLTSARRLGAFSMNELSYVCATSTLASFSVSSNAIRLRSTRSGASGGMRPSGDTRPRLRSTIDAIERAVARRSIPRGTAATISSVEALCIQSSAALIALTKACVVFG